MGEYVSSRTMKMIASAVEMEAGQVIFEHPRCGKTSIRRNDAGLWVVEKCENPDKEEAP